MYDRKAIKRQARQWLKRSYALLLVLCAVAVFLGTEEFASVVSNAQTWYDILTQQQTVVDVPGVTTDREVKDDVLTDLLNDNLAAGRDAAAQRLQTLKDSADGNAMLGRQRGILAAVMNNINSGKLNVTVAMALRSLVHSREAAAALLILGSLAVPVLVWIFLRNIYQSILRRAALELRRYETLPMSHLLYFKSVGRWVRASLTLLLTAFFQTLWDLTIVGGLIKRYAYFLVPYIVAENPDIRPREAIKLSRRIMDGHKWECCKLELSFLGWMVLGFVTFGAVDVLWSVPYRVAAYSEYYAHMRQQAKAAGIPGAERLNDECLFAPADEAALKARYEDILRREDIVDEDIVTLPPFKRFLVKNFGLWTGTLMEKKVYSRQAGLRQQMRVGRSELEGRAYPQRMNPLWHKEAAALTGRVSYLTPVTVWSLIVVFFAFSMVGWVWEVSLAFVTEGMFVNRGMLHGPWLPIYGGGVVLIAVLLYRLRNRPALEVAAIVVLCGFVEYMTSWITELSTGMRWWDYTGYFLNLNGRICGEGLAVFALGGMAAVYLLLPILDAMVTRINPRVLVPVCTVLLVCFAGDMVYSRIHPNAGAGITDYKQAEVVETASDANAGIETVAEVGS